MSDHLPEAVDNATTTPVRGSDQPRLAEGVLHIFVAFDWGDETDLEHAQRLTPSEPTDLIRRRRTPPSITYRPAPLRFRLESTKIELPDIADQTVQVEATVFDFGAVSVVLRADFGPQADLSSLASALADSRPIVELAKSVLWPLFEQLRPAIRRPQWNDLSEEYFVFQIYPTRDSLDPARWLTDSAPWIAGLVRLEVEPLSEEEIAESLRLRLGYGPSDLFIPDWSAAVLFDQDCEETLQIVEFANVQLLEFRHIDHRLDSQLDQGYQLIHALARSRLPFWRSHTRPLRALGDIRVETNVLYERTTNVLKLVGDQYLARAYNLLAQRFHLQEWGEGIQRSLDVAQGTYQVLADQAATYRNEFLELVIILLIAFEILMALIGH